MGLPLYEVFIDENEQSDAEVTYVALVDKPAIEKDFMKFNEQKRVELKFAVDNERRIISGPAMLADMPIYRKDEDGTEYMIVFRADAIQMIVQKYFAKLYTNNFNIMHDAALKVDGIKVFNSFISDKELGVLPMKGFEDVPNGSWFISAKVNNDQVWDAVKAGTIKGFSVEGNFYRKEVEKFSTQNDRPEVLKEILQVLNDIKVN